MRFTATIEISADDVAEFGMDNIREGIHARLFPVASCHPDEITAVAVIVEAEPLHKWTYSTAANDWQCLTCGGISTDFCPDASNHAR